MNLNPSAYTDKEAICGNCNHWKETIYNYGECIKIREKFEIELVTGWDGGYVNVIETENDFGCNQFEGVFISDEL